MAGKHAPIAFGKYIDIQETAMGRLERGGYVLPNGDGLTVERVAGGVLLWGPIRCAANVTINVTKRLAILRDDDAIVQAVAYTYHVIVEGVGNLLRYCGPHDDDSHPGHKPFHHKHTYELLRGDVTGTVTEIDPEGRPTLAEVIIEACTWSFEHATALEALRVR